MKKSKHIVGGASIAVLLAAGIVGNSLCSIYYSQIQAYMQRFVTSSESANSMTDLSKDDAYTQALQLCEEVESEGLVLLKNDNDTLPLGTDKINLFGYNSYKTVYTDYGSGGHHNEDQNFNFIDGFEFAGLQLNPDLTKFYQTTAQKRASMTGMTVSDADFNIYEETLAEYDEYSATFWQDAKAYSDVAVYVIGRMAGEGGDCPLDMAGYYGGEAGRHYLQLQPAEEELLAKLEATFDKVIIVINASNPMDLGFIEDNKVDAAIWAGGPGTTGTIAVAKAMMGEYNPSGHLVDTYAYDVTSSPAYENFGDFTYANSGLTIDGNGDANNGKYMYYQEGIYVGYRYYETRYIGDDNVYTPEEEAEYQKAVQYPFGYGLSYTSFEYSDLKAGPAGVTLTVTNTGSVAGAEIVQLYVAKPDAKIFRPAQELKGFARVFLNPGESRDVTIPLDDKAFRYWNVRTNHWEVEGGCYELRVGASCEDIRLRAVITVEGTVAPNPYEGKDLLHYQTAEVRKITDAEFEALLGRPIPESKIKIDRNMTLGELSHGRSPLGWAASAVLGHLLRKSMENGKPDLNILFQYNMPLRALAKMTNGAVSMGMVDGIVMEAQGFWIIGLLRVAYEAIKNVILNAQLEKRLHQG